jgi:hypothetical protein
MLNLRSALSKPLRRALRPLQPRWASTVQVTRDDGLPDLIITPVAAQVRRHFKILQ